MVSIFETPQQLTLLKTDFCNHSSSKLGLIKALIILSCKINSIIRNLFNLFIYLSLHWKKIFISTLKEQIFFYLEWKYYIEGKYLFLHWKKISSILKYFHPFRWIIFQETRRFDISEIFSMSTNDKRTKNFFCYIPQRRKTMLNDSNCKATGFSWRFPDA